MISSSAHVDPLPSEKVRNIRVLRPSHSRTSWDPSTARVLSRLLRKQRLRERKPRPAGEGAAAHAIGLVPAGVRQAEHRQDLDCRMAKSVSPAELLADRAEQDKTGQRWAETGH